MYLHISTKHIERNTYQKGYFLVAQLYFPSFNAVKRLTKFKNSTFARRSFFYFWLVTRYIFYRQKNVSHLFDASLCSQCAAPHWQMKSEWNMLFLYERHVYSGTDYMNMHVYPYHWSEHIILPCRFEGSKHALIFSFIWVYIFRVRNVSLVGGMCIN